MLCLYFICMHINQLQIYIIIIKQSSMPVIVKKDIYEWLKKIGIFKQECNPNSEQYCQIPYDEQIYLQNGYLIGVALRKFVKPYSQQYQQLLKVRKIATLQQSQNQNWHIIQPFLNRIGCDAISSYNLQQTIQISPHKIAEMLQSIWQQYGPKQQIQAQLLRKAKKNFIDIYNFDSKKQLKEADNSLELLSIVLVRTLNISLREALGLLFNHCKYLKKLVIDGSKTDEYLGVAKMYQEVIANWAIFQDFIAVSQHDLDKILQGLSSGVQSQSINVVNLALTLISLVKQQSWFITTGYYKLLSSNYLPCFNFTIQKLSPNYSLILNQTIHTKISNPETLLTILLNLIKILPKTIYSKEILNEMPISYFYEQCYVILNVEEIDDQPPKLVNQALELLAKLIIMHTDKIPSLYVNRIFQTFRYQPGKSYPFYYYILALLFDIVEGLVLKQSPLLQKFFKMIMKYFNESRSELRHWILLNFKIIYQKWSKYFPVGCFLSMHSLNAIAQSGQYQMFDAIAQDLTPLNLRQQTLALNYLTNCIETQLHSRCFLTIVRKFLKNHNKESTKWGEQMSISTVNKMNEIKIPLLNQGQINVLNPKPPIRARVVNSIGLKRKEMLKFNEYQLAKQFLQLLIQIKDKNFLGFYLNVLTQAIASIQKQIGNKKKELLKLFKKLKLKVKKQFQLAHQPQSMDKIARSIIMNRSRLQKTTPFSSIQLDSSGPLSQSKLLQNYSQIITQVDKPQTIQQQPQQQQKNQFLSSQIKPTNRYDQQQPPGVTAQKTQKQWQFVTQFTEQQQQQQIFIYTNSVFEHNELFYINAVQERHRLLVDYFADIYRQFKSRYYNHDQNQNYNQGGAQGKRDKENLMGQLGVSNLIELKQFQTILKQLEDMVFSSDKQFIQSLIIQISFLMFQFKRNRRVQITCLSSVYNILSQKTRQESQHYRNMASTTNPKNPKNPKNKKTEKYSIFKNVLYENKLSTQLFKGNKNIKKYMDCFQILSQIFQQKFGIFLMEPLSKQINNIQSASRIHSSKQGRKGVIQKQDERSQLQLLEQQLKLESIQNQPQMDKKQEIISRASVRSRKLQAKYGVNKPNQAPKQRETLVENSSSIWRVQQVDNRQLREKLSKRLKILGEQLLRQNEKKKWNQKGAVNKSIPPSKQNQLSKQKQDQNSGINEPRQQQLESK